MQQEHGLTLLELIITLAITAITTSGMAVLSKPLLRKIALRQSADQIVALVHFLRASAVSHGCVYSLNYDARGKPWYNSGCDEKKIQMNSDAQIRFGGKPISIYPTGTCSPKTAEVFLGADTCTLSISLRGRVSVIC